MENKIGSMRRDQRTQECLFNCRAGRTAVKLLVGKAIGLMWRNDDGSANERASRFSLSLGALKAGELGPAIA